MKHKFTISWEIEQKSDTRVWNWNSEIIPAEVLHLRNMSFIAPPSPQLGEKSPLKDQKYFATEAKFGMFYTLLEMYEMFTILLTILYS